MSTQEDLLEMRIELVFSVTGTRGDINPLLAIAKHLKDSGYTVHFLANDLFETEISQSGINFYSIGNITSFEEYYSDEKTWDPMHNCMEIGFETVYKPAMHRAFDIVSSFHKRGKKLKVVTLSNYANGASLAAEVYNIPRINLLLSPNQVPSDVSPPAPFKWALPDCLPSALKTHLYRWMRRRSELKTSKLSYIAKVNKVRHFIGAERYGSCNFDNFKRGQNYAALYPKWFAPHPIDSPAQIRYFDFINANNHNISDDTESAMLFVQEKGAAIIATEGTGFGASENFLETCIQIASKMQVSLIFIKGHGFRPKADTGNEQVLFVSSVSLPIVLPHCLLIIHHGGIGTTSAAIKADIPQIIKPIAFDQFDNAEKTQKLRRAICVMHFNFKVNFVVLQIKKLFRMFQSRTQIENHPDNTLNEISEFILNCDKAQ